MLDLDEIRKKIDAADTEIVRLLEQRIGLAKEVAAYKIGSGKKVYDSVREKEKLARVESLVENTENVADIRKVFEQIMLDSRKIQYRELELNGKSMLDPYETIDDIPRDGVKVVYQGVPGAYAYIAMKRFFKDPSDAHSVNTWREALEEVVSGKSDFAVLPLENSTAGSVTEVYDLLSEYPVYIVAEEFVEIDHALLGVPGTGISDIKKVYSTVPTISQIFFLISYQICVRLVTH